MPCYRPVNVITGSERFLGSSFPVRSDVPCGQCIGCRLRNSQEKGLRAVHESKMHEENCFITLTYAPEHIPLGHNLNPDHLELFWKKFRSRISPKKIRYLGCGEYGSKTLRPHYHAIVFGYDFSLDRYPWRRSSSRDHGAGHQIFRSPELESLWEFGNSEIGSMTFQSASYVARYITKRRVKPKVRPGYTEDTDPRVIAWRAKYETFNPVNGECFDRYPEFGRQSNRPGIGKAFYDQFKSDIYPSDECVLEGRCVLPPRYYDKLLQREDEDTYLRIKESRKEKALVKPLDAAELLRREEAKSFIVKQKLKRSFEDVE